MSEQTTTIDQETGLPVLVPGMKQGKPETPKAADERRRVIQQNRAQAPQPLATRHLDKNYNPALEDEEAEKALGPKVKKRRCLLRAGYYFYHGRNMKEAFRGPAILWLTDDQIKGQIQKLEILDDKPAHMHAKAKPVAVVEHETSEKRQARIAEIRSELEVLEQEEKIYAEKRAKPREDRTLTTPSENEAAEDPILKESGPPAGDEHEVEASMRPPGAGQITGPDHNPEAGAAKVEPPKKRRGRPPGKSKLKKDGEAS